MKKTNNKYSFKKKRRKITLSFTLTSILLLGTSFNRIYYVMEDFKPENNKIPFIYKHKTYSFDEFYDNIHYKDNAWKTVVDGDTINLYNQTDFRFNGDYRHRAIQNLPEELVIDTIKVKPHPSNNIDSAYYFYNHRDSIQNIPSMGSQTWNKIKIRKFISTDPEIQKFINQYNDEYNCTYAHEKQHFLNALAGTMKSGQSYETKFVDLCMDEISANIAQLLAQKENYKKYNDTSYITSRFDFYKEWIDRPIDKYVLNEHTNSSDYANKKTSLQVFDMSTEEARFIAENVFDKWMEDKFDIYHDRVLSLTKHYLNNSNYNGCLEDKEEHNRLMNQIFTINGTNFYPFIEHKEKEIRERIPESYKKEFQKITDIKKSKQNYFSKLGLKTKNSTKKKHNYFNGIALKNKWNKFKKSISS